MLPFTDEQIKSALVEAGKTMLSLRDLQEAVRWFFECRELWDRIIRNPDCFDDRMFWKHGRIELKKTVKQAESDLRRLAGMEE